MTGLVDKVFVINLAKRTDRMEVISSELNVRGIEFERWEATENENGVLGLLLSMKALFNHCLSNGLDRVLILEDDCTFHVDPVAFLKAVASQVPKDFHCLYLGLNLISKPVRISENILRITGAYSTHSLIYTRKGMELILPILDRDPTPYDLLLFHNIHALGKSYCTYPMIATQRSGYSDIDRVDRDWGVLMSVTYSMQTKNLARMENNEIPCRSEHLWDGKRMVELLDPMKHEAQHPELWGKACDCGRMRVIAEGIVGCACDGSARWEFQTSESV